MDSPFLAGLLGFGLAGIAALSFTEKFLPVLPSYVLFVLFGLATVQDAADLGGTVAASTLGSVLGAIGWYAVGRIAGNRRCEDLVGRFGKYLFLRPELYRRLMAAYERHHFWVTLVGQTIPTARIYLALPAGVTGLPFAPFVLATTLGTLAWNAPLITTGYLLRDTGWSPAATGIAVGASLLGAEALVILLVARIQRLRRRPRPAPP